MSLIFYTYHQRIREKLFSIRVLSLVTSILTTACGLGFFVISASACGTFSTSIVDKAIFVIGIIFTIFSIIHISPLEPKLNRISYYWPLYIGSSSFCIILFISGYIFMAFTYYKPYTKKCIGTICCKYSYKLKGFVMTYLENRYNCLDLHSKMLSKKLSLLCSFKQNTAGYPLCIYICTFASTYFKFPASKKKVSNVFDEDLCKN
ncbi:hypothetical protein HZS_5076 [Henneguya salminicola]|nr:hypothetical protein HZS_5076 [Henneguya salminicola]